MSEHSKWATVANKRWQRVRLKTNHFGLAFEVNTGSAIWRVVEGQTEEEEEEEGKMYSRSRNCKVIFGDRRSLLKVGVTGAGEQDACFA
jgi:hypothetical protein